MFFYWLFFYIRIEIVPIRNLNKGKNIRGHYARKKM